MNFFLKNPDFNVSPKFNHQDSILMLGSCFAENIGSHLQNLGYNTLVNPMGIMFNPASISKTISILNEEDEEIKKYNFEDKKIFKNWLLHSKKYASNSEELTNKWIETKNKTINFISEAKSLWVVVTLGSSFIYFHKKLEIIVANCHKMPSDFFDKKMLDFQESYILLSQMIENIKKINPSVKFIFTISPVRYIKDGLIQNNLSKSNLFLCIEKLKQKAENVFYFPAYELVVDVLRDYRFYKEDKVHPSDEAIKYIFDFLKTTWFETDTQKLNTELDNILSMKNHKILHKESEEYLKFKENLNQKIKQIKNKYPNLNI